MGNKANACQGTLALKALKAIHTTRPVLGYGIASPIEQATINLARFLYLEEAV